MTDAPAAWPTPTDPPPTLHRIAGWTHDTTVDATDGCPVEPDATCPHGHPSWLLRLRLI